MQKRSSVTEIAITSLLTENQNGTIGDIHHAGRCQFPAISSILVEFRLRCNERSFDSEILITVCGLNFLRENHRSKCKNTQQENDQYQSCKKMLKRTASNSRQAGLPNIQRQAMMQKLATLDLGRALVATIPAPIA